MATDVEESDRISPKRQRTLMLTNTDELVQSYSFPVENERRISEASVSNETNNEEIHIKIKLQEWQARQVEKAFLDNAINEMMENLTGPFHPSEYRRLNLRVNHMENEAVTMAIRNHGLVCLTDADPHTSQTYHDSVSRRAYVDALVQRRIVRNALSRKLSHNTSTSIYNKDSVKDKYCESDQRQDFLERAVAVAIEKKGLSALTVDYG